MQAVIQHRATQMPSRRLALTALLAIAGLVMLGILASGTRETVSQDQAPTAPSTSVQKDVELFPSDVMDSHESVSSLAALRKTVGYSVKPL